MARTGQKNRGNLGENVPLALQRAAVKRTLKRFPILARAPVTFVQCVTAIIRHFGVTNSASRKRSSLCQHARRGFPTARESKGIAAIF